jgi:hypothetical protein
MSSRTSLFIVLLGGTLAGIWLTGQARHQLRFSFTEKDLSFTTDTGRRGLHPTEALRPFGAIVLPEGYSDRLLKSAVDEMARAIALRTGSRPLLTHSRPGDERVIEIIVTEQAPPGEVFRLEGDSAGVSISASNALAAARGAIHVADLLYAGAGDDELARLNTVIKPAMRHRLIDVGGVGIVPDSAAWRREDYSHHHHPLSRVLISGEPHVDLAALAEIETQFQQLVDRVALYGYNGISIKGFLEFVNFDYVGNGTEIYAADSPIREQRRLLRAGVRRMLAHAKTMGVSVVLYTDMLALSDALEAYLHTSLGGIDASDTRLWDVYRAGLRELFEEMPEVSGVIIRIGEAGALFNGHDSRYYSRLAVHTRVATRLMLTELSEEAAAHGKTIFFRTWSVGTGEVGNIHTRPEEYDQLLADIEAPNLVVSTKFVMGDFFGMTPLNPTLKAGRQPRIIEVQARREYEFAASFPNFLGGEHQRAIQAFRGANPQIDGLWVWAQDGGPQRRSSISLYPFHGFWQLIDADVYAAGRLAWEPDADIALVTRAWVRRMFGGDGASVDAITEVLLQSRQPVEKGLYVRPFARRQLHMLGLEPPPMLWIFQWDILTSSNVILSAVYRAARDELDAAMDEGFEAVALARAMRERLASVDESTVHDPALLARLVESVEYKISLLEVLATYRAWLLTYYRWLDRGGAGAHVRFEAARKSFEAVRDAHLAAYADDLDFRALRFFDADVGLALAQRARSTALHARVLLGLLVLMLLAGTARGGRRIPAALGRNGFRALWEAVTTPGQRRAAGELRPADALVVAVPAAIVVTNTLFVATSYRAPVTVGLLLAALASVVVARVLVGRDGFLRDVASLTGPLLVATSLPLAFTAVRGPGYFWLRFWESDVFWGAAVIVPIVLAAWIAHAQCTSLRHEERSRIDTLGRLLVLVGLPTAVMGGIVYAVGLKAALRAINDELVILPVALPRILSVSTHMDLPLSLPLEVLAAGATATASGFLLILIAQRFDRARRRTTLALVS